LTETLIFQVEAVSFEMSSHSSKDVDDFLGICRWANESWNFTKQLFDNNDDKENFENPHLGSFFEYLYRMSTEYSLLQIVKLHDPAVQQNSINLSLEYIVEFGGWDNDTLQSLREKRKALDGFFAKIKGARNKIISHNDLATIRSNDEHGTFTLGEDEKYFLELGEFCDIVSRSAIGEPFTFVTTTRTDVIYFLRFLKAGIENFGL